MDSDSDMSDFNGSSVRDAEQHLRLQQLVKLLNEQVQQKPNDKEQEPKEMEAHIISSKQDNGHAQQDLYVRAKQDIDQEVMPTLSLPVESPIAILSPEANSEVESRENKKKDAMMDILQLINENSDKLEKSMVEYAKLGMWDFAGQFVFYTTHQTFLNYRAVYILVIDLSQPITALIKDECFLDTAGLKPCQVQEMINTWMNSIHSCTPSPQSSIPAVILVGTHADKITEEQLPAKGVKSETQTMTSDTVDITLPTTSTHADTATNEQPRPSTFLGSVWKFLKPRKSKRTVEKTTGSSRTASAGAMSSPKASDTDRFMCIAYLLVDVGPRVLTQLLSHHTVTSTCTLGQYLAKNLITINSLGRVFNHSQMDIIFPPNGDDTNLDDYDITLLSAIFQNIVQTLSQQEKDMIKRLREERNKLYGHAKSCQISANDFQTYWNDISSILTTLSQQCMDTAFEAKILQEIQHIQIAGIPAGSFIDVLKTWLGKIETVEGVLKNVTTRLQTLESREKSSASES